MAAAAALLACTPSVLAQKDETLIRKHILGQLSISSDRIDKPAVTDLLTAPVYEVSVKKRGGGTSYQYMAVQDGNVFRVPRSDAPESKEALLKLLPDDFKVDSLEAAKRLVAAGRALHNSFFEPDMELDEMRVIERDGEYLFIDGERFDKLTGYRIATGSDGEVTAFEYSMELSEEDS